MFLTGRQFLFIIAVFMAIVVAFVAAGRMGPFASAKTKLARQQASAIVDSVEVNAEWNARNVAAGVRAFYVEHGHLPTYGWEVRQCMPDTNGTVDGFWHKYRPVYDWQDQYSEPEGSAGMVAYRPLFLKSGWYAGAWEPAENDVPLAFEIIAYEDQRESSNGRIGALIQGAVESDGHLVMYERDVMHVWGGSTAK